MKNPERFLDEMRKVVPAAFLSSFAEIAAALPVPRYTVEICREDETISRFNVSKTEANIGRGSQLAPVDIPLPDEPKISSICASLRVDENDRLWVTALGANPTRVAGIPVPQNATIELPADGAVEICGYRLKFRLISQKRGFLKGEFLPKKSMAVGARTRTD